MANITMLPVNGAIRLGGEKVIALNDANINTIKTSYNNDSKVLASQSTGSNKDLLTQSFGNPTSTVLDTPNDNVSKNEAVSAVVTNTNNSDLETSAVNLNMMPSNSTVTNDNNTSLNIDDSLFKMPEEGLNPTLSVEASTSPLDIVLNGASEPKVSVDNLNIDGAGVAIPNVDNSVVSPPPSTNIFDSPLVDANPMVDNNQNGSTVTENPTVNTDVDKSNISLSIPSIDLTVPSVETNQEELASSSDLTVSPVDSVNNNQTVDKIDNSFSIPNDVVQNSTNEFGALGLPTMEELKKEPDVSQQNVQVENESSLSEDILNARIALERSNAMLFKKLAENSEQMAKLLQSQIKNNNEHTASDLFNSNGSLDENKVLGYGNRAA